MSSQRWVNNFQSQEFPNFSADGNLLCKILLQTCRIRSVGSENDSLIFMTSKFGIAFDSLPTKLRNPDASGHAGIKLPYVLIGNKISLLKPWLIKPYPRQKLDE